MITIIKMTINTLTKFTTKKTNSDILPLDSPFSSASRKTAVTYVNTINTTNVI